MRKLVLGTVLSTLACGDPAPPALTVGTVSFTHDQLLGLSDARRTSLTHLTAFGLAVADSTTDALGAPLVRRWEEERLSEILAADLTLERNGVDDEVLEARYLTDPDYELTVRHVLFFSERWRTDTERAEARAKAEHALDLLRGGADFAETAGRLSEEPGAEGRQGLLTPGREGAWVDEFWAMASTLGVGDISPVTETQYGFHILRLEHRAIVPFAEARSRIARQVADRMEDPREVLGQWLDEVGIADPNERHAAAVRAAESRTLSVPDAERANIARGWDDLVYRWSNALGFQPGLSPTQVGEHALQALARTGQEAQIARTELAELADIIEARYAISFPEAAGRGRETGRGNQP